jgi:probable rRNA maturation factor
LIEIENIQSFIEVDKKLNLSVEKVIEFSLQKEMVNLDTEINLVYVDNKEIKNINFRTRKIDKETDVLSFPMINYPKGKVFKEVYDENSFYPEDYNEGRLLLGDIVLSLEKAFTQSQEFCHSFEREVCYLCIHSLLHLLGYDHIIEDDKIIMRKREEEILSELNIIR